MPKEMRRPPPDGNAVELTPLQQEVARAIARELEQIWNTVHQSPSAEARERELREASLTTPR